MPNGDHSRSPFVRPPTPLEKLQMTVGKIIDMVLAIHALNLVKGTYTHAELSKMMDIVAKVRPKMSESFSVEEGLKAIMAAFRIEMP